jgi:hypothetical protein
MIGVSARYELTICAVFAILAGCSTSQRQALLPSTAAATAPLVVGQQDSGSWMSPDATHQDLVYVSDAPANSVKVYGFTTHKLVGTLTGINGPFGVCDDPAGYVWVVAWGNNKIIQYAHGGTKVLKILSVPNSDLYDCAVDPTTGNLAVTNWGAKNWYRGNVLIFKPGSSKPETYAGGQVWFY